MFDCKEEMNFLSGSKFLEDKIMINKKQRLWVKCQGTRVIKNKAMSNDCKVTAGFTYCSLLISVFLLFTASAWAAEVEGQKVVARVVEMNGLAAASQAGSEPRLIATGAAIYERDGIATGSGSYAVIIFSDGTRVTLSENSRFAINQFDYNPLVPQKGKAYLTLLAGNAEVWTGRLAEVSPDAFLFESAMGVIRAHGTGAKEESHE